MNDNVEIERIETRIAERHPPGDRWVYLSENDDESDKNIQDSLTDMLELIYQKTGKRKFTVDAENGIIYIIKEKEKEIEKPKQKKYSLYDEY